MNEYEMELAKLQELASRRDFSPEGDAAYHEQFIRVKLTYWRLCAAGVRG